MYGLKRWTIGDPLSTEQEAIDAVVCRDGTAVDETLAGLTAAELNRIADDAEFLAECCRMAARGRA